MKRYVFKQDISGSNDGYTITDYNKNDVVDAENICEYLTNSWLKAGIIKEVEIGEEVEEFLDGDTEKLPEGTEEITEEEAEELKAENETEIEQEDVQEETVETSEEEKVFELVSKAKEILTIPAGANLSDEDIEELKEIGIELKIKGMSSSKKPQAILDKINGFIDEYETKPV